MKDLIAISGGALKYLCAKYRIPAMLCSNDGKNNQRGKNYWMVKRLKQLNARP